MSSAVVNGVTFGVQHNMMRFCGSENVKRHPLLTNYFSGACAGAAQAFISSPAELIKTRLQLDSQGSRRNQRYRGPWDCVRAIAREEGFRGLFRGYGATLLRDSPGFGFYFAVYEYFVMVLPSLAGGDATRDTPWVRLCAGGTGGIAAWLFSYPFDVVKSRMQGDGVGDSRRYKNMLDCFRKSYREGGLVLFTRGLGPTLARAFPVNAVTFYAVYFFLDLSASFKSPAILPTTEMHESKKSSGGL